MQANDTEFEKKLEEEKRSLSRKRKNPEAEAPPLITPQLEMSRKKARKDIKQKIMHAFTTGNYTRLERQLSSYVLESSMVGEFFTEYGDTLFRHALLSTRDDQALLFLHQKMPSHLLLAIIRKNNFSIIKSFLAGEAEYENLYSFEEKDQTERVLKLKAVLKIDPTLKVFFEKHASDDYLNDNIRDAFKQTLMPNVSGPQSRHR